VKLFASYRERVGQAEVTVELPDGATVGSLAAEVVRSYPAMARYPGRLVVAVNQEYREHGYPVHEGDEVALIPPVSGGGMSEWRPR
jgi:molybdopterin synthase catalytic subunit